MSLVPMVGRAFDVVVVVEDIFVVYVADNNHYHPGRRCCRGVYSVLGFTYLIFSHISLTLGKCFI